MNPREAIYDYLIDHHNASSEQLERLNDMTLKAAHDIAQNVAIATNNIKAFNRYMDKI